MVVKENSTLPTDFLPSLLLRVSHSIDSSDPLHVAVLLAMSNFQQSSLWAS